LKNHFLIGLLVTFFFFFGMWSATVSQAKEARQLNATGKCPILSSVIRALVVFLDGQRWPACLPACLPGVQRNVHQVF
jgi:hypothetical protein